MVVMEQARPKVGDVYVRRHWRHGILWKVQVTGVKDDLVSFATVEYGGKPSPDDSQTIHLISKFLEQYRPYNPEEDD